MRRAWPCFWLAAALLLSACGGKDKFVSKRELEAELRSFGLVGKSRGEAISALEHHGFSCNVQALSCVREAHSFPCVQDQSVLLQLDASKRVVVPAVGVLKDGRLPTACL